MNTPLSFSSSNAIWYGQVPPELQGRVLSADHLIGLVVSATSTLIAGPLADYVFEPGMQPNGYLANVFGGIFGTGSGSGMALLYSFTGIWIIVVGVIGYCSNSLQKVVRVK